MAKRKKSSGRRRTTGRRRSVGKIADKNTIMLAVGVTGGAILATVIGNKLTSLDPKIKAAIMAVGGVFVAKQNNPVMKGAGLGLAASGITQLAKAFNVLPAGIAGAPYVNFIPQGLSGFNNYPNFPQSNTIAGFNSYPNSPQLNTIGNMAFAGIS